MRSLALMICAAVAMALGCADHTDPPRPSNEPAQPSNPRDDRGGVHIQTPNVDIKAKRDKGVDVEAPNTKVKVHPKDE
jgi:hypothetical protein